MSDHAILEAQRHDDPVRSDAYLRTVSCHTPIAFGSHVAEPASRSLFRAGVPVELGGRAFDLLMILLRSRGDIVSKDEIFHYVWPCTTVDESNLRFQMAQLRKALGSERDFIKTIQGRGYLMVATDEGAAGTVELRETGRPSGAPTIFVVEGDEVIRTALRRFLGSFDARVASFSSIQDLVESNRLASA